MIRPNRPETRSLFTTLEILITRVLVEIPFEGIRTPKQKRRNSPTKALTSPIVARIEGIEKGVLTHSSIHTDIKTPSVIHTGLGATPDIQVHISGDLVYTN